MEIIIKKPKITGNSASVGVPKSWMNMNVKVELIQNDPSLILRDVLDILEENNILLENIIGIYLTGSYARKEETIDSDIDMLILTKNIKNRLKKGRYDILLIDRDEAIISMKKDIFPLLPMTIESKALLNKPAIDELKQIKITKKNIRWYIKTTYHAIRMNEAKIERDKLLGENKIGVDVAYSLVLRYRTLYLIDCLIKNKNWSSYDLKEKLLKISGSLKIYEGYLHKKNDLKKDYKTPINDAEKLLNYIEKENKRIDKLKIK